MLQIINFQKYKNRFTAPHFLKLCIGFSIFDSAVLLELIFLTLWLYNVITPFKTKILQKPQIILHPDIWFLRCNNKKF